MPRMRFIPAILAVLFAFVLHGGGATAYYVNQPPPMAESVVPPQKSRVCPKPPYSDTNGITEMWQESFKVPLTSARALTAKTIETIEKYGGALCEFSWIVMKRDEKTGILFGILSIPMNKTKGLGSINMTIGWYAVNKAGTATIAISIDKEMIYDSVSPRLPT